MKIMNLNFILSTLFCYIMVSASNFPFDLSINQFKFRTILVNVFLTLIWFLLNRFLKKKFKEDDWKEWEKYIKLPSNFNEFAYSEKLTFSTALKIIKFFFGGIYIRTFIPAGIICFISSFQMQNQTMHGFIFGSLNLALNFTVAIICIRFLWQDYVEK